MAAVLAAAAEDRKFQDVTVRPGDTLWSIARAYLRDPAKWDEIVKHNVLPSADPTVALPGMTLRVPVELIKDEMRAASLIYVLNRVNRRRAGSAAWQPAREAMKLYRGDALRTFSAAKAKVEFVNAELLSLDPDSLAIIKPPARDYDVELKSGGVFAGRSRVVTVSARITPKTGDTQYSAKVRYDLSTLVEVYKGVASVDAQGKVVDVPAGMGTEIKLGQAPGVPKLIADLPEFEARAAAFAGDVPGQSRLKADPRAAMPLQVTADDINASRDVGELGANMKALSIGQPISGYRVQASRLRDFSDLIFDKSYSVDEPVRLKSERLPTGIYWWRVAIVDLLGAELPLSAPRLYSFGVVREKSAVDLRGSVILLKPAGDERVSSGTYRVAGLIKAENLSVRVNGKPARIDDTGNFFAAVELKEGVNTVDVQVSDALGNSAGLTRRVVYAPAGPR
ncbi:MAG: LysM peptidoglycan-binding domain-containing protein [Elusimicrobia bacterium]|nr:LysM peptidoglycan-binding domain-containing protein [Elusimicrobiota bacterium]